MNEPKNLKGVKILEKNELKLIKGNGFNCYRTSDNGMNTYAFHSGGLDLALAWLDVWRAFGYNAWCYSDMA